MEEDEDAVTFRLSHMCLVHFIFCFADWMRPFTAKWVSGAFGRLILFVTERFIKTAYNQKPRSSASDKGLLCLPRTCVWDAGQKWGQHDSSSNTTLGLRTYSLKV